MERDKPKGDCIIVACNNVLDNPRMLLCYAKVMGQGKLKGKRILHAWNEFKDIDSVVIDFSNGKRKVLIKKLYYSIAEIQEKDVEKKDIKEVSELLLKHGTYGGWIK